MNKRNASLDYKKILNVLYIIISLAVMTAFLFSGTPRTDEYIGAYGVAFWGTILAALIAIVLAVSAVLRAKK